MSAPGRSAVEAVELEHRDAAAAEEIRALLHAAYRIEAGILGVADFPPLARTAAHFAAADARFFGCREGGRLVAVTEIETPEPDHVHVGSLGVHPDCFRRGLGRGLLERVLERFPGRRITVSTGAANAPAIRLYEQLGFAIARRWATPEEGIPMVTLERAPRSARPRPGASAVWLLAAVLAAPVAAGATPTTQLPATAVERFAGLALACVHQEYPNKIAHVLASDADVKPPRELTPVFSGCYDWHSSVHGHWLLSRLARLYPEAPFAARARAALEKSFTAEKVAVEVKYLEGPGRISFERPYGLAWLLQLAAELREWDDADARRWSGSLAPLERLAAERLASWLPKLTRPIRVGEHDQTAFALGLALDWARDASDAQNAALFETALRRFYLADRSCPLGYEPSGHDFLSPCLAEADALRRVLPPAEFAAWLSGFLPALPVDGSADWLEPGIVTDPSDPKLAHLDGLNLSRAWMLEGIAAGLPASDPRRTALLAAAKRHRDEALPRVTGEHYEGGHWLGSFATYLVTGRGLPAPR